jgi:hypothetical protein
VLQLELPVLIAELSIIVVVFTGPADYEEVPPAHAIELVVGNPVGRDQAADLAEQLTR